MQDIFKVMKGKNLQPRLLYPARISFRFDGEIRSFKEKQELKRNRLTDTENTLGSPVGRRMGRGRREEGDHKAPTAT